MTPAALEVRSLGKSYRGTPSRVVALEDVSFDVAPGETLALLGPNGAGKTTLMKIASGLLIPDCGHARIAGREPYADRKALRHVGSLLEGNRNLYWKLTPRENLAYFGTLKGMKAREIAQRGDPLLAHFDLGRKLDEPVQRLSRGMQQKLAVCCTILHRPPLLLLDEPTLGLDIASAAQLVDMIRTLARDGTSILLSTHQLDIAQELGRRIVILDHGRVVKLAATEDLIRSYSQDCYEVRVAGPLAPAAEAALRTQLGMSVADDGTLRIPGGPDELYAAIDLLRPTPIAAISRHRADLSTIFLQLTKESADGR